MAEGTGMPPRLLRYWLPSGEGGAKIRWGEPGDYNRCIVNIQEAVVTKDGKAPLSSPVVHGLCATLHKLATGASPGHAATEQTKH